ncbi:MAG: hypothetical protein LIO54_09525 [Oscillospiraceae bacterium]|nr:hypothetical protein [Oscillospiraceae bacterium]
MIVNASAVFESAIEKQLNMTYYAEIMQTFRLVDVSADADFQRAFVFFYRVRRGAAWRAAYFRRMEDAKKSGADFAGVLTYLYEQTGNVEPSFTSKMLATLDPAMPIWDSIVLSHLGLELTGKNKEDKLQNAVAVYDQLCGWYKDFLQTPEARENIAAFDGALPRYRWLSDTKKIDFLMWGDRD